jgi:exopolysaccharide biosynthesis polyprenyl glycosylphosphotransferase
MLKERARLIAFALFLVDLAAVSLAFLLAHALRSAPLAALFRAEGSFYPLARYLPLLPIVLGIWAAAFLTSRLYHSHRTIPLGLEAWEILKLTALAAMALVLAVYLFRLDERILAGDKISRLWIGLLAVLAFLLIFAERAGIRIAARRLRARGFNYRTILLVGTTEAARAIARSIDGHRYWGYRILGFLSRDATPGREGYLDGHRILGRPEDLVELVEREPIDEVIFAVSRKELEEMDDSLQLLQDLGIAIRLALYPLPVVGKAEIGDLDGIPLLSFSFAPANPVRLAIKRTVDVVGALTALALLSPLLLIIAGFVRGTSKGPMLYRQTRVGLNGRRFTLLKFRTMFLGSDHKRRDLVHLNEMSGPVFKIRGDPRITPIGRLMRRYSLDELPQLFNVLRGDMSLVGPRPLQPEETFRIGRKQRRRLSMRPGLTCLWQISGRNDVDFDQWMALDLEYIDSWSPGLDLKILFKTIPAVISGRGAF